MKANDTKAVDRFQLVRGLFLFCVAALLIIPAWGCAGKDFNDIKPGIGARGHYIEGVPFYKQKEYACGPAALAGVLAFWRHPIELDQITVRVYMPELRGTLPMDMERFAKDAGFKTEASTGTLDALKASVQSNVPVICLLDLGFSVYKQPHYVTVIGFDDAHRVVIMHDGITRDRLMPFDEFNTAWERAGKWMIVIRP